MNFVHQMLVKGETSGPENGPLGRFNKLVVEQEAGKYRTGCQHAQRNQHGQRAFVRMIAAGRIGTGLFRRLVDAVLNMFGLDPARRAPEGQEHQPPAVEAGQQCSEHTDGKGKLADLGAAGKGDLDDRVLGIETGKAAQPDDTDASDRQRSGHHRPEGQRDFFPQAEPAPRNRSALKKAWVNRWNIAAL